jgi:hypothetical protein
MDDHILQCGVYRHFKGNYYLVNGLGQHTETGELLVEYVSLAPKPGGVPKRLRPLNMFLEDVEANGVMVPRFTYVGTSMPEEIQICRE